MHPAPVQVGDVDPKIWRACAGGSFRVPPIHSRVYYFPQGHIEHASSAPSYLNEIIFSRPAILCRVCAAGYHADPVTDEVFVKLSLLPLTGDNADHFANPLETPGDDQIVSFAKVLTRSDANNGGGFSVPRYCADSIFPPLNFKADRPTQTLHVTDVLGNVWEFRHIYRGTPRRHLLTTGWSNFVNNKKLVAGDSVVFMKNSTGTVFVGIRRDLRFAELTTVDFSILSSQLGVVGNKPEGKQQQEGNAGSTGKEGGFARNGKGKLPANEVADAAQLAAQYMQFEVVYYPRAGWSDFVVDAEVVGKACGVPWTPGARVKMAKKTDDSARISWFQGTISSTLAPDDRHWWASPWRKLQVTWDEPEVMQNAERVSPWEVELVSPSAPYPPAKRYRDAQYCGVATDGKGGSFSLTGLTNSTMGHLNQSLLNYNTVPAGMQGARQDLPYVASLFNIEIGNSHLYIGDTFGNMVPTMKTLMSTEPNIDSSRSNSLSPESQITGTEFVGAGGCNLTKQGASSIRLFGKLIQLEQPVESTGDEGSNGCKGVGQ